MRAYYFVGLDLHKKTVAFCVKKADGEIVQEGVVPARRERLLAWQSALPGPWKGAMEATLFTGWIYDLLDPYADELKVGNPRMLEAIVAHLDDGDQGLYGLYKGCARTAVTTVVRHLEHRRCERRGLLQQFCLA